MVGGPGQSWMIARLQSHVYHFFWTVAASTEPGALGRGLSKSLAAMYFPRKAVVVRRVQVS